MFNSKQEFFIRIEVNQLNTKPSVKFGNPLNIQSVENGAFVMEEKMKDIKLTENLVMALPNIPQSFLSIFPIFSAHLDVKMVGENPADNQVYFVIQDTPKPLSIKSEPKTSFKFGILWVENRFSSLTGRTALCHDRRKIMT